MPIAQPKPKWLRRPIAAPGRLRQVTACLSETGLHTVCQEAACPNHAECFGRGEATFLLLGPNCTRNCRFCNVTSAKPVSPRKDEPEKTAEAAKQLGLKFVVLTMVTRDDLDDGGACQVSSAIGAVHAQLPGVGVEALVSDFRGSGGALNRVLQANPQVLAHNVETVPRLYAAVRPQADYLRSLKVLEGAASAGLPAKSGLMLGLGEKRSEVLAVLRDLRSAGCVLLTLGQYLSPSSRHHPVKKYLPPEEFASLQQDALSMGFIAAASGPYVRSSYRAGQLYQAVVNGPPGGAP